MFSDPFTFFYTKHIYGKSNMRWLIYIVEVTSWKIKKLDEMVHLGQHIVRAVKSGSCKKTENSFMANKQQIHSKITYIFLWGASVSSPNYTFSTDTMEIKALRKLYKLNEWDKQFSWLKLLKLTLALKQHPYVIISFLTEQWP